MIRRKGPNRKDLPARAATRLLARVVPAVLLAGAMASCARPAADREAEARRRVAAMDLRSRIGQLVVPTLALDGSAADSARLERLRAAATARAIGGVWIEGGDARQVRAAVRELQALGRIPLLVGADLDGGVPVSGATAFAAPREIAALGDPAAAAEVGRVTGEEALAVGINFGLVSTPPINGSEPVPPLTPSVERAVAAISDYAAAAARPGLAIGVRSLWSARADSRPLLWDRARLEAVEIATLRPLLMGDPVAVALGSVGLPAFGGDSAAAFLSPAAADGLLRRDLGWSGPVLVDLHAATPEVTRLGIAETAIRALQAGADLLVRVEDPVSLVAALQEAVRAGRLDVARIDTAAVRVLSLKTRLEIPAPTGPDTTPYRLGAPPATEFAAGLNTRRRDILRAAAPLAADTLRLVDPAEVGMDGAALASLDSILGRALEDSVFTAAAVAVGRRGRLVRLRGFGTDVDPTATIFDIASLTKVVATATAAALLIERGMLSLDAPVSGFVPGWTGPDKGRVTVRHLLTHTSGLPSGLWLYGNTASPDQALRRVIAQSLIHEPGERAVYSDLGMILLAEVVERAAGQSIDRLLARGVFAPLGMQHTMFLPPVALRDRIVRTAGRTEREFPLQGVVHDANAFRLAGVAGHAGLFSTARDLAVFAQMLLDGGSYAGVRIHDPATIEAFTRRQPRSATRALAWDTPADRSSAGRFFSARSFGHTGYTGTSLWIDPERDLFVVLLTNRTLADASALDILRVRAALHEAAARAITDQPLRARPGARPVR